jgi:hypothetical protein
LWRSRHAHCAARRCAATPGSCGSGLLQSKKGPSHGCSCGGSHLLRNGTLDRRNAISAAGALLTKYQSAPALRRFRRLGLGLQTGLSVHDAGDEPALQHEGDRLAPRSQR